jgi:uncharacterized protein YndB with AHSA1/START domain
MTFIWIALGALALLLAVMVAGGFLALAMGRMHLDLGWGRSRHELGPLAVEIDAPREIVYEVLSAPYLRRVEDDSIDVLAGGDSVVVAAHLTKVHFYEARTVEAIELDPPERIGFRHLTGPVPEAVEEFRLETADRGVRLHYEGTLGIDFFLLGRLAARHWVVPQWNRAVAEHLDGAKAKAEQRARHQRDRKPRDRGAL